MSFNELAKSRRSVRRFTDADISGDMITTILEAAQAAPSAGNCQPWHFYVVRDKAVKEQLKEKAYNQSFISVAPVVFVICADIEKTIGRYGERGRHLYCIQDTSAAIQNMLLCIKELGLGACWCGAFDENDVSAILNLKKDMRPVAIIPVGHVEIEPNMPKRRPLEEIATFI